MTSWILENTLIAAIFALVVALVCRVPRVPPVIRHALWLVVLIRLIMPPVFSVPLLPADWQELVARHWDTRAVSGETVAGDSLPADHREGASVAVSAIRAADDPGRRVAAGAPELSNSTIPALDIEDANARKIEGADPGLTAVSGVSPPLDAELSASVAGRGIDFDDDSVQSQPRPVSSNALPVLRIDSFATRHMGRLLLCSGIAGTLLVTLVQSIRLV